MRRIITRWLGRGTAGPEAVPFGEDMAPSPATLSELLKVATATDAPPPPSTSPFLTRPGRPVIDA